MSRWQTPRTPDYFPRMKYRARKRRKHIDLQLQPPSYEEVSEWLEAKRLRDLDDVAAELSIDLDEAA
ncbi:hypothetical protein [Nocardia sp. NPDC049707]|uniref:hypothetical protein n=1 Tax=Nocardia sp. NPDC049707 TaxID=3154735 RepID=UPI0034408490